jgi:alpha-tubulin suppressor-like RCC1 family protein
MRVRSKLEPAALAASAALGRDVQLVFQQPAVNEYAYWKVHNGGIVAVANYGGVPAEWSLVGGGDITGDGIDDLLWQHTSGTLVRWALTPTDAIGSTVPQLPYYAPPPWRVVATADLNADGNVDLVWQQTNGDVVVWLMNGQNILSSVGLGGAPPPWRVVAAGTMRVGGSAVPVLLWEQPTNGARVAWVMTPNLLGHSTVDYGVVPTAWSLVALADYDGDGESDFFWQNPTTAEILVWLMNGTAYRTTVSPGSPPPPWRLRAVRYSGASASGPIAPMVAVGGGFACALGASGNASCWGSGPLGNGVLSGRSATPVAVQGGGHTFRALTAGVTHACALTVEGEAYCWGSGGLGRGAPSTSTTPQPVVGGLIFRKLDAGYQLTCGLTPAGRAYCWGVDGSGQLGNGTTSSSETYTPTPVQQGSLLFTDISVAQAHACALATDGRAYCWGDNTHGELGDGSVVNRSVPVAVSGGLTFASITTGAALYGSSLTCGLTAAGQAYCWGSNASGELGNGTTSGFATTTPQLVQGGRTFTSLAIGGNFLGLAHVCGLTSQGQAYCWGTNVVGQLGTGEAGTTPVTTPTAVAQGGLAFTQIAAGGTTEGSTCAMTAGRQVHCWGDNSAQQLGNGSVPYRTSPVLASTVPTLASVVAGDNFSCGLTPAGAASCWGRDRPGTLGRGASSAGYSATPVSVAGALTFASLASFSSHSCGLTTTGQIHCWGAGRDGQLGNGGTSDSPVPVQVQSASTFSQVTVGERGSCALTTTGQAYCWGVNTNGQLGDGTTSTRTTPVAVQGGLTFRSISSGYRNTCGVSTADGKVYCWGWNGNGELTPGHPSTGPGLGLTTPTLMSGQASLTFNSVVVGLGTTQICALSTADQAYCWTTPSAPAPVSGAPALKALAMGSRVTCGLTASGQAYCWGDNVGGVLGNGSTSEDFQWATPVVGGLSFKSIAASGSPTDPGVSHVCGVTTGGQTYCWGSYARGQLGDGAVGFSVVPVAVASGTPFNDVEARGAARAPARPSGARVPLPTSTRTVVKMPDPTGTPR